MSFFRGVSGFFRVSFRFRVFSGVFSDFFQVSGFSGFFRVLGFFCFRCTHEKQNPHPNPIMRGLGLDSGHKCKNASEPTPVGCKTHGLAKTQTRTVIPTVDPHFPIRFTEAVAHPVASIKHWYQGTSCLILLYNYRCINVHMMNALKIFLYQFNCCLMNRRVLWGVAGCILFSSKIKQHFSTTPK
jgi:hypothetical protein